MAAEPTESQVARVTAWVSVSGYSPDEDDVTAAIALFPVPDERGTEPYYFDASTPPERVYRDTWIPTFDLHRAAVELLEPHLATLIGGASATKLKQGDLQIDGDAAVAQVQALIRYHKSRSMPTSIKVYKHPKEPGANHYVGNLSEVAYEEVL